MKIAIKRLALQNRKLLHIHAESVTELLGFYQQTEAKPTSCCFSGLKKKKNKVLAGIFMQYETKNTQKWRFHAWNIIWRWPEIHILRLSIGLWYVDITCNFNLMQDAWSLAYHKMSWIFFSLEAWKQGGIRWVCSSAENWATVSKDGRFHVTRR